MLSRLFPTAALILATTFSACGAQSTQVSTTKEGADASTLSVEGSGRVQGGLFYRNCSISAQLEYLRDGIYKGPMVANIAGTKYLFNLGSTLSGNTVQTSNLLMYDPGADYTWRTFIGAPILAYVQEYSLTINLSDDLSAVTSFELEGSSLVSRKWVCNIQ